MQALRHLALPAITLALPMAAPLMRVTRASMLEVLRSDYVTFAEAKGLSRRRVLWRHALKNALMPTVTIAALETGSLLGGNMIVESVFGWPGLGRDGERDRRQRHRVHLSIADHQSAEQPEESEPEDSQPEDRNAAPHLRLHARQEEQPRADEGDDQAERLPPAWVLLQPEHAPRQDQDGDQPHHERHRC